MENIDYLKDLFLGKNINIIRSFKDLPTHSKQIKVSSIVIITNSITKTLNLVKQVNITSQEKIEALWQDRGQDREDNIHMIHLY